MRNQKFEFPVGYRRLHRTKIMDYQLNRWYSLGYIALAPLREAARRIGSLEDWKPEMVRQAEKAVAEGRMTEAAFLYRAAEFFALPSDPDILSLEVRKGELEDAERWHAQMITAREGYLLRWGWVESEQRKRESHGSSDARLELGSHPIAEALREMQLGRVLSCEHRPRFQAVLSPVVESFRAEPAADAESRTEPAS
jgi:hypothetical protein